LFQAVNLCICLSYPLNFGIYCGMSRQFRETFKELFIQRVTGQRQPGANGIKPFSFVAEDAAK
jgi:hypothetical protein